MTDEIGYTVGKNRFVAGLQFEHNVAKNGYLQGGAGYYVYETWDDFKNDREPLAFRIAHGNNDALAQEYPQFTYMQYSIYLQDEINFSERFKATVGIRFEVPSYPSIDNNENKDFTQAFANYGGYKTSDMPKARLAVAPRVGFNWDMTGERKYILRGGTASSTAVCPFVWLVSVAGNSNCIQNGLSLYKGDSRMPQLPHQRQRHAEGHLRRHLQTAGSGGQHAAYHSGQEAQDALHVENLAGAGSETAG